MILFPGKNSLKFFIKKQYDAVIAVHGDKKHIHAHLIFNSVNADTGLKYHSNDRTYYSQIWTIFAAAASGNISQS